MNTDFLFLKVYFFFPLIIMCILLILRDERYIRFTGLIGSVLIFLLGCVIMYEYQMYVNFYNADKCYFLLNFGELVTTIGSIKYILVFDGISLLLLNLMSFLQIICVVVSRQYKDVKFMYILLYLIQFLIFNVFSLVDLFLFFIVYECVLFPLFIIIGFWGKRERKISASYRFFFYTFIGSLPMLYVILQLLIIKGTTNLFDLLASAKFTLSEQRLLWLCLFISFAVKTPIYPFHSWLPEAHAEAPTVGSILLAGVLLKMGPYGLFRFANVLFPYGLEYFFPLVVSLVIISIYYSGFVALMQIDLKKIIAYSSIGHMSFVILGMSLQNFEGLGGSFYLMISHGLVSAGLFLVAGMFYERYGTRIILYYGGLMQLNPNLSFFFFLLVLANIGFPGTSGFVGEFVVLLGLSKVSFVILFLVGISLIFVCIFNIWLFCRICFGNPSETFILNEDLVNSEKIISIMLILGILIGGFHPSLIFEISNMRTYIYI